jgi:protein-disulfide isomerase
MIDIYAKSFKAVIKLSILFLNLSSFLLAQEYDLSKEIHDLKLSQEATRKELMEIKAMLSKIVTPSSQLPDVKGVELNLGSNQVKGSKTAKLAVFEFSDYQCSFCSRYNRETFSKISEQYIATGIIKYIVIDYPLSSHKYAAKAAEASHCAGEQGKYWEFHNLIMSKQESISDLLSYAAALNLDTLKYEECIKSSKYADIVSGNSVLASKIGIKGVPGFIIAATDIKDPSKATGISYIPGALPFDTFQKEINNALMSIDMQKQVK